MRPARTRGRNPLKLAERQGFEPWNTCEDVTGIPVQRLRPLGHLSEGAAKVTLGPFANQLTASNSGEANPRRLHRLDYLTMKLARQRHQRQTQAVGDQA